MQYTQNITTKTKINGGAVALLVILFTTTSPAAVPAFVIVAVFAVIAWLLYSGFNAVLKMVGLETRKRIILTIALTVIVGMMLVLQAAGQLTLRDFLGFVAIYSIGWLYVSRFSLKSNQ